MNKIVVTLEEADLVELQAILMDKDPAAALRFVETRIAVKLPQKGTAGCDSTRRNPYLVRTGRKH